MTNKLKTKIKLKELKDILEAQVLWGEELLSIEINSVFASDLMSDVLAFVEEGSLLLSGLVNQQIVRTAEMAGIAVVCTVRGKLPQPEAIALSKEKNIPLLATNLSMYEACGRLYKKSLRGCNENK